MEKQQLRRSLEHRFSDEEIKNLSRELALENQNLSNLENQKKSVVSEYGSRMSICREQIGVLSDKVASGYEMRDIMCDVEYHAPEKNRKQFTRTDTGDVWSEPMCDADHNLFTTWERKEAERLESEKEMNGGEVNYEAEADGLPENDFELEIVYDGEYSNELIPMNGDGVVQTRGAGGRFTKKE